MAFQTDKKYTITAKNMEECREKLFQQYGNNYKIIDKNNVYVSGGFLNLQKRGAVKVTYVLVHQPDINEESVRERKLSEEEKLAKNRDQILKEKSDILINAQINQINSTMQEFMSSMDKKLENISAASKENPESIDKIDELLEQNEFTFSYIRMIEDKIRNSFSLDELNDFDLVQRRVVDWIGESIEVKKDVVVRPPHVFIIVGPTGVGKTTTLVKMAVQFVKKFNTVNNGAKPQICFITTDTMRVGAMEQLERWGDHMETRVLKAERTDDLVKIFDENKNNVDAIFIDTSGYSPNDAAHLAQIKLLLDVPGMNPDVYLAVTASTKARDLHNIMKNYEPFGYNSVIVTKCDESEQYGNVISVLNERHKSVSYITSGQIASRDIAKANVIDFLINLEGFKIDRVHIENVFGE